MPSFREVLTTLHKWYEENRNEVRERNNKLREALESIQNPAARDQNPLDRAAAQAILQSAAQQVHSRHDTVQRGYAASIDADAGGEEGGFHVWRRDQVEAVLAGKPLELFLRAYGLDQAPNFEGQAWHLQRRAPAAQLGKEFNESQEWVDETLAQARQALRAVRETRVHPTLDRQQATSWNALLAEGFIRAGRALGRADWLDLADCIFSFIRRDLWKGEGLMAVYNSGEARFEAYLDDYAWLLNALTLYLQARWDRDRLEFAIQVADAMLRWFEDEENGGFFFSDVTVDVPIMRSMIFQDDATPAGNAIAIPALNRLGRLLGDTRYTDAADRCMRRSAGQLADSPMACSSLLPACSQPAPSLAG
jgi:uncharacterized protein YyaL (SSP411 family)